MSGVEVRRYVGFHPLKTIVEGKAIGDDPKDQRIY